MLHKQKDRKSIFEDRFKYITPSDEERRHVFKANEECFYYLKGIESCSTAVQKEMLQTDIDGSEGFYKCKPVTESYFRCVTRDKVGTRLEDMDQEIRPFFKNFTNCIFRDRVTHEQCRDYHDDILRHYIRNEDERIAQNFK